MKFKSIFIRGQWLLGILICLGLFSPQSIAGAVESKAVDFLVDTPVTSPLQRGVFQAPQGELVFSGRVDNENSEQYDYFFQIRHHEQHYRAEAVLINAQTNTLVLFESSDAIIEESDGLQWQIGRIFLRFNRINNSWIFGVKPQHHDKQGYNFKIDMLGQPDGNIAREQDLRSGLQLLIGQTGNLNGHVEDGTQETFVTAPKAWFRQMWVSKPQQVPHPFTAILCDFNDGSGFYAVNLHEHDALRGAMAGWRNSSGVAEPMSQFVHSEKGKDGKWHIDVPFPKLGFTINDALVNSKGNEGLVAGTINGKMPGFCVITQHDVG